MRTMNNTQLQSSYHHSSVSTTGTTTSTFNHTTHVSLKLQSDAGTVFWSFFRSCCGMAAVIATTLRPHVGRFGGELAVHDAGLRALASSVVPDPRVRWSRLRCYATDDSKRFRQWQSIRRPSFWQSVVLCLLSSRFRRIEHQTCWTCTALWPRSVALRIRSLAHEVLLAQLGIGDAAETTASVHAL